MTDLEISKALALAIGWEASQMKVLDGSLFCKDRTHWWKKFDYRDPAVIWPIAERYNAFPFQIKGGVVWEATCGFDWSTDTQADTAAKAVALAVIAGAKK